MKTLLTILLFSASALAQTAQQHAYVTEGKVAVEWHFTDEYRVWLSINTYNGKGNWKEEGYHPSYCYILSQYKPMVRKLPNGQYQITFASEIAQDVP